jgi:hypothetical protein
MKLLPHTIPDNFSLSESTKAWLEREYPQIDQEKTLEVFTNKMSNAIDYEKRSPYFGQQIHALNWNRKFQTYVRIAMVNKWTGSVVTKQGSEIDMRWQEVLTHAKAIGCPLQRRPSDTVDGFRTRVKMWEQDKPKNRVLDFSLKALR